MEVEAAEEPVEVFEPEAFPEPEPDPDPLPEPELALVCVALADVTTGVDARLVAIVTASAEVVRISVLVAGLAWLTPEALETTGLDEVLALHADFVFLELTAATVVLENGATLG